MLVIEPVQGVFAVCKLPDYSRVDLEAEFCFTGKTDAERSLVCLERDVPENVTQCERGWRAFRVRGPLEFSLVGILSRITACLADAGIGLFALSTYNTDYVLVKEQDAQRALEALEQGGFAIAR